MQINDAGNFEQEKYHTQKSFMKQWEDALYLRWFRNDGSLKAKEQDQSQGILSEP